MRLRRAAAVFLSVCCYAGSVAAFSFSEDGAEEQQAEAARRADIEYQLSTPCKSSLKAKKIAVMIGEYHDNGYRAVNYGEYGPHFQEIENRLRQLGLRTYSQKEIQAQIAAAEMAAVLNNDPDAAMAASGRLGANFILRGLIRSRSGVNPVAQANEVFVDMSFSLSGANGRFVSSTDAHGESWSGEDTSRVALSIVRENADQVVADLYHDYCTQHR